MNSSTPSSADTLMKPSKVASAVATDPEFFTGVVNAQFGSGHHGHHSQASASAQSAAADAETATAQTAP